MKVALVISSLGSGGAERVISNMANYWAGKGWSITLVTLEEENTDFYRLDEQVSRLSLGMASSSCGIWKAVSNNILRLFALRSAIRSTCPDAVISFMDRMNVLTLLATRFTGIPVIVSERTDPRQEHTGKAWQALRSWTYRHAAALVVQTQNVRNWAVDRVGEEKVSVIHNSIVRIVGQPTKGNKEFPQPYVLAVGRLGREKGFDLLLRAFRTIYMKHSEWSLVILGEGTERLSLEIMAREFGFENRFFLPGRHPEPMEVMAQASIFVLPSRHEGFPNALLESMACGLPAVSFDCPSGPREIIRHGIDGILVPPEDVDALTGAMDDLIAHPEKRERLASRAFEVIGRFGMNRIMGEWEDLVGKVARQ